MSISLKTCIFILCQLLACISCTVSDKAPVKKSSIYSAEERSALEELRPLAQKIVNHDYQLEDSYLIRWLWARDLNPEMAYEMLAEAQEWRKVNQIDSILNETFKGLAAAYPVNFDARDNDGAPVAILKLGKIDVRRLLLTGRKDEIRRLRIQAIEILLRDLREVSNKTGKELNQFVTILDFAGFNFRQQGCPPCLMSFLEFAMLEKKYYPEVRKHYVWVNIPRDAANLLDMVKRIAPPSTQKILKFFHYDKDEWSAYLRQIIPADQLTKEYGGTKSGGPF